MGRNKLIIFIVLFAFLLRIIDINNNPKSMYGDELTLLLDAESILKTGHDTNGQFLPLHLATGGGRPAGYVYATIPFVAIFGTTTLAVKSVSILSGVGIVILMYLVCSQLLSRKIGLFAAILTAINPWELSLSRGGFESHFALFLALMGFYLFLKFKYIFSAFAFALAMHIYSTYTFTIPVFAALLLTQVKVKKMGLFILIIGLSLLLGIYFSFSRGSSDRFSNINIFSSRGIQNEVYAKILRERSFGSLPVNNKITETAQIFIHNYTRNFSPDFLFIRGDENPRHNPGSSGALFWFQLPLLIIGSMFLYSKFRKIFYLLLGWLLIPPIAASLVGGSHFLRNSFMLPPLIILCAASLEKIRNLKRFVILVLLLTQLPFFINRFYFLAPNLYAYFWSYKAKAAVEKALIERGNFEFIILSSNISDMEYAYPIYSKEKQEGVVNFGQYKFIKYGNIYIGAIPSGDIKAIMDSLEGSVLYMGSEEDRGGLENEEALRDVEGTSVYVYSTKN